MRGAVFLVALAVDMAPALGEGGHGPHEVGLLFQRPATAPEKIPEALQAPTVLPRGAAHSAPSSTLLHRSAEGLGFHVRGAEEERPNDLAVVLREADPKVNLPLVNGEDADRMIRRGQVGRASRDSSHDGPGQHEMKRGNANRKRAERPGEVGGGRRQGSAGRR